MTGNKTARVTTVSRREFLKGAAGMAVALPVIVPASVFGADAPSNRITVGCIGVGGKGSGNMKGFNGNRGSEVVAVCDVDAAHRERACKSVDLDAKSSYRDFRDLLARDDIDAVSIATPDHWHVPTSIAAVRTGKDVYCEKP
jgi:predicted dehydrogenase